MQPERLTIKKASMPRRLIMTANAELNGFAERSKVPATEGSALSVLLEGFKLHPFIMKLFRFAVNGILHKHINRSF